MLRLGLPIGTLGMIQLNNCRTVFEINVLIGVDRKSIGPILINVLKINPSLLHI